MLHVALSASTGLTFQVLTGGVVAGFDAFVAERGKLLSAYSKIRSEVRCLAFLSQHPWMLDEVAHVPGLRRG